MTFPPGCVTADEGAAAATPGTVSFSASRRVSAPGMPPTRLATSSADPASEIAPPSQGNPFR